jgi:hypothetical protein
VADVSSTYRNALGFLRTYADGSELRPFHVEQRRRLSDQDQAAVLKAQGELIAINILLDHVFLSEIGRCRFDRALAAVERGLAIARRMVEL